MIWIIFAHYIGDWALQNDFVAKNKGKCWIVMLSHCMVWTACICIMMKWLNYPIGLGRFLFLFIGHWAMDKWKCDNIVSPCNKKAEKHNLAYLYVDQFCHLMQCFIVYLI